MFRDVLVHLSESSTLRRVATRAPGARTVARRFVAGETVEDGIAAARELNAAGISVTLDNLGESVETREEARAAADTYLSMIRRIVEEQLDANVSLKLTQMGQDIDEEFMRENVGRVLDLAREHSMFVRLDMESSAHTQRTLDFFRRLWDEGYRNVGIVLQSYLLRTADDARMANELGARVRLCKGAYVEPPAVAFQEKARVDANFVEVTRLLLEHGTFPAIATHDPAMIDAAKRMATTRGIARDAFEFQTLYGIRRDLQRQLVEEGWGLRVYVPFGDAWYPYLMRRMAERPANLFFIVNAVLRESPLGFLFSNGKR